MSQIKLIVAGGRDFNDYILMQEGFDAIMTGYTNDQITLVSGMAQGADQLAFKLAEDYGLDVIEMPADWNTHGKAAGPIRNDQMAKIGTHLLVAWDGKSRGTKNMIEKALARRLTVKIINYKVDYPLPKPIQHKGL
jgi:hypothetical protein